MNQPRRIPRMARWAVPAGAVAAAGLVTAGTVLSGAQAAPRLPARTAAQLLASVQRAAIGAPRPMTATVTESASLGLPSLPDMGSLSAGLSALSGTHTMKVWYADPAHVRVALLASMGETDLRLDGRQAWLWQSSSQTATHLTLPARAAKAEAQGKAASQATMRLTPQQAARQVLAAVGPTTTVGVQQNVTVAGQAAYQLRIAPRSDQSLIGQIRIAIDAANSMPLRLQVFARGATSPALQIGFSSITWGKPAASNFAFTPPKGAKVKQAKIGAAGGIGFLPGLRAGLPGLPFASPGNVHRQVIGVKGPIWIRQITVTKHGKTAIIRQVLVGRNGRKAVIVHQIPAAAAAPLQAALKRRHGTLPVPALPPRNFRAGAVQLAAAAHPQVLGKGWLSVAVLPAGAGLPALLGHPGFAFTGPAGAAVAQVRVSQAKVVQVKPGQARAVQVKQGKAVAVRQVPAAAAARIAALPGGLGQYLPLLEKAATPVHGGWGSGRLLQTALASVLITSKGQVLIGAVTPSVLYADAAHVK